MSRPLGIVPLAGRRRAAPKAPTELQYHGGSVLGAVQVVPVFWGTFWSGAIGAPLVPQINAFFTGILASPWMDVLWEYSTEFTAIDRGRLLPSVTITTSNPTNPTTDAQLQASLQSWIQTGAAPKPTANTLYFLYLPQGVVVTDPTGAQSCVAMCGYHSAIGGGPFYAVIPYAACPGCYFGSSAILDILTKVSSHELAEAVTDPAGDGWFDSVSGEENGDICNDHTSHVNGFWIQSTWSNAQNDCAYASVSPTWSHPFGAADRLSRDIKQFAVAKNGDGRLEVFMIGSKDSVLYHKWQTSPGGAWYPPLETDAVQLSLKVRLFTVVANADHRLEVFIIGSNDGHLYHKWQTSPGGAWSHPVDQAARLADDIDIVAVEMNRDGRLEAFMRNSKDLGLLHAWQLSVGGPWSRAVRLSNNVDGIQIAANDDGRLEVFVKGHNDGHLYHKWQRP